ncbi:MAG: site-2 protease family protein [Planctomycetes bacterium]|nr:site-2 protease family protein [Planctomycetota bacterium]
MALLLTIFGIGFLLFIHELGHFLAARAAGVRVEVFALGMGPRVAGFKRNGTDYRIAAIPIGGYVKMAGEDMLGDGADDELFSKSPRWRFLIFSGGILMNFLFALLLIPILFRIGVPVQAPIAGSVVPGGTAWKAGVHPGDRLVALNDKKLLSFSDFASTIALSNVEETLKLDLLSPDGEVRRVEFQALYDESIGFPTVGVYQGISSVVAPDSVASKAGIKANSEILAVDGVVASGNGDLQTLLFQALLHGNPLQVTTLVDGVEKTQTITPQAIDNAGSPQLGIFQTHQSVRELHPDYQTGLRVGDRITHVGDIEVRDQEVIREATLRNGDRLPTLTVVRDGETLELSPTLTAADFSAAVWLDVEPNVMRIHVRPGGPAAQAGLQNGDVISHLGLEKPNNFAELRSTLKVWVDTHQSEAALPPLPVMATRGDEIVDVEVQLAASPGWDYGIGMSSRMEVVKETSIVAAIGTGVGRAQAMVRDAFLSFQRIITGRISTKNLSGIITIGRTTHSIASVGLVPFLFFLCMISIHLGVLNLLPIPALDGGHLMFLLIEGIRGKPVSERVQIWFNLGGFVLVMSLVVFVTILDIQRLVP